MLQSRDFRKWSHCLIDRRGRFRAWMSYRWRWGSNSLWRLAVGTDGRRSGSILQASVAGEVQKRAVRAEEVS